MQREGDHDANLDVADEHAPNYLSWIADLCRPHLGPRVLEVGAGYGAITARYQHGRQVVANDVSPSCVNVLRQRFADTPTVRIDDRDLRTLPYRRHFDSVLMVNVLEHIPDDVAALAQLGRAVVPGGTIVVYVPALNGLYGPWDRQVGHYRRYSVWRLREVFRQAQLQPLVVRWVNLLAIPAWAACSRDDVTDRQRNGRLLSLWDRTAVPTGRFIESRISVPIGLNVLGVARVTAESEALVTTLP